MPPISRKQWGAKYADGFRDRPMPITEYWLHHSVTQAPDLLPPFDDDDAAVRTLERIGQERFKGGISYTYPVTPVGRLYQGLSLDRQGAHTLGHNTIAAAFVLVGDYRKRKPSAAQIETIARQMVEDHRAGRSTRHTLNGGHRQASKNVGTTECPGDAAIAAIPAINARANELWAAGYPNQEDDVTPQDKKDIIDGLMGYVIGEDVTGTPRNVRWALGAILRDGQRQSAQIAAIDAVDTAGLAAAVVAALPANDLTADAVAKAIVTQLVDQTQSAPQEQA